MKIKIMAQYISKAALIAEIEKRSKKWQYGSSTESKYRKEECDDVLSFLDTLEVKDVDLIINTIIAECCDWLTICTDLSLGLIEDCRNLMLAVKEEQFKAQKGE